MTCTTIGARIAVTVI